MTSVRRLAPIEGLRGIAALLVALYHIWILSWFPEPQLLRPFVECGFLGVELFFFISGFVLTLPYARAELSGDPRPSTKDFFLHRVLKIVPSYWLCIAFCVLIGYDQVSAYGGGLARNIIFHVLFIHNWWNDTAPSISGVLWTLAVEVQFYVLFPWLIRYFLKRPILVVLAMFAIANAFRFYTATHSTGTPYYWLRLDQLPASLDLFAAGMGSALIYERRKLAKPFATLLAIAGVVGFWLLCSGCLNTHGDDWPYNWKANWRSALALDFCCLGLGFLGTWRAVQWPLTNRVCLFFGTISYNLYLWHLIVARLLKLKNVLPSVAPNPVDDPLWKMAFLVTALALSVAVATVVTFYFERPILRKGRHLLVVGLPRAEHA